MELTCDICGRPYPAIFRKLPPYYDKDIPMSDEIMLKIENAGYPELSRWNTCDACTFKVMAYILNLQNESRKGE